MDAYLTGLEQAKHGGHRPVDDPLRRVLLRLRVDTEIDKRLDKLGSDEAKALRGKAAIANARLAYERYEKVFASDRWAALEAPARTSSARCGPRPASRTRRTTTRCTSSTSSRPNTVNTMPEATLDAVADHGQIRGNAIAGTYDDARAVIDGLNASGIGYDDVIEVLEVEGVQKFEDSYAQLAESVRGQLDAATS